MHSAGLTTGPPLDSGYLPAFLPDDLTLTTLQFLAETPFREYPTRGQTLKRAPQTEWFYGTRCLYRWGQEKAAYEWGQAMSGVLLPLISL